MFSRDIKFWNSIVSRFALFFTGLLVFVILLSGYLVFRKSSVVIIQTAKERVQHSAQLAEQAFYALLNEVSNDIAVISSNPSLQLFINDGSTDRKKQIQQLFNSVLTNKPDYFQIRLIDNSGQEIVRYDKIGDAIIQISDSNLQQKGSREYFKEAMEINPGEYYFSRISLNEEYNMISDPPIVTLRVASPLSRLDQSKCGIVVINVNLSRFYEELTRISASGVHFHLVDESGQYLYTQDHQKEFGLQRATGTSFVQDYDIDLTKQPLGDGSYINGQGNLFLDYVTALEFFKGQRKVYLVTAVEESTLLASARRVRKESLQSLFVVCLVALLLSFLFIRLFSNQINMVTQAITNYEEGIEGSKIPVHRKDEIGLLARSFAAMRSKINETVDHLNTALKEEKKSKTQRDQLLQNMSHELRTPLHTIQGLSELLMKNRPTKSQIPIISSLQRSVQNLTGLVYDVLDHQKLVEGKLTLDIRPTNLRQLIEEIYQNYQYEAMKKGLDFRLNLDRDFGEDFFLTDQLRLSQILTNLVVNAIKFTDKGMVILDAHIDWGSTPALLALSVTDTGVGMAEENLRQINQDIYKENIAISGRYGSYGLGISIVKQLLSLLQGSMVVSSEVGQGSCFQLVLPVTKTTEHVMPAKQKRENALPVLTSRKVIIQIDDDISSLDLFSFTLSTEQFEVIQCTNFELFFEKLRTTKPDLIISDLVLNEKNYFNEIGSWIAKKEINCPLIIVSAQETSQSKLISPYAFQKPFDPSLLIDQIYTILGSDKYQTPNFNYLYKNYDHQMEKVNHALQLLEAEFLAFIERLRLLQHSDDPADWETISHKLISQIRTLSLTNVERKLQENVTSPANTTLSYIIGSLQYCLCCIRLEKWTNSKD